MAQCVLMRYLHEDHRVDSVARRWQITRAMKPVLSAAKDDLLVAQAKGDAFNGTSKGEISGSLPEREEEFSPVMRRKIEEGIRSAQEEPLVSAEVAWAELETFKANWRRSHDRE